MVVAVQEVVLPRIKPLSGLVVEAGVVEQGSTVVGAVVEALQLLTQR